MRLAEDSDIIPVEPMDDATAHTLLHKKLRQKSKKSDSSNDSSNDVAELASNSARPHAAGSRAGSSIHPTAPRCSVQPNSEDC